METLYARNLYASNCRSFLKIARYWAGVGEWDKAIDSLKAAIRSANKAKMLRTAGMSLVAIRRCQDARKHVAVRVAA